MYCQTYPLTDKRWGFDLILTNLPLISDLIDIYKQWGENVVLKGHLILAFAPGGEEIDFIQVKSPPLARGVVPGAIH